MAFFVWSDELSVGHTEIDNDHRKLIKLVDDLYTALEHERGRDALARVLADLIEHTKAHFRREERIMRDADYGPRPGHEYEHAKLLREMAELQKQFAAGDAVLTIQVSRFLREWLFKHIKEVDQPMMAAVRGAGR